MFDNNVIKHKFSDFPRNNATEDKKYTLMSEKKDLKFIKNRCISFSNFEFTNRDINLFSEKTFF